MTKLISILIPSYNAEKSVGQAIESALNQSWGNKEIIIVDDGSNDCTLDIARRYESKIVKVVHQENRGAAAARNRALELAQGEYIQWLDADDLLAPDKIACQLEETQTESHEDILLSSSWGTFYQCAEKAKMSPSGLWRDLSPVEWLISKMENNSWMAIESWLVNRKLTKLAGPWNEALFRDNDGEYFCRVVSASKWIKFIPEAKCYCRIGNKKSVSSSFSLSEEKLESLLLSVKLCINYLIALEDSNRSREAAFNFLRENLRFFILAGQKIPTEANKLAESMGYILPRTYMGLKHRIFMKVFGEIIWRSSIFQFRQFEESCRKTWEKHF